MSKARDLANAGTALTTVSATELGYLDGVTSAIQTQINSKIGSASAINPTILDAKGDLLAASAADTAARLAVGSNDTVLTADSSTATGLKWATPAAGGMTVIASGSLSGTTMNISSIPSTYVNLQLLIKNWNNTLGTNLQMRVNNNTGANYAWTKLQSGSSTYGNYNNFWDYVSFAVGSGSLTIQFPDYANSGSGKSILANGNPYPNAASMLYFGGVSETSAISSIQLINTDGASFNAGTYTLYGVK